MLNAVAFVRHVFLQELFGLQLLMLSNGGGRDQNVLVSTD